MSDDKINWAEFREGALKGVKDRCAVEIAVIELLEREKVPEPVDFLRNLAGRLEDSYDHVSAPVMQTRKDLASFLRPKEVPTLPPKEKELVKELAREAVKATVEEAKAIVEAESASANAPKRGGRPPKPEPPPEVLDAPAAPPVIIDEEKVRRLLRQAPMTHRQLVERMGFMSPPKPLEQIALFKFLEGLVKSGEAVRNQFEASRYQLKIAE